MITFQTVMIWLFHAAISFIASAAFSIIFHSPKNQIIPAGLTGAVGWLIYVILGFFGIGTVTASFFATVGLASIARMLSFARKAPVTIFLVTGIFPLVPGIGIYNTGYSLFMSSDNAATFNLGLTTIEVAVAIALGMGLVLSLPQIFFSFKKLNKKKELR